MGRRWTGRGAGAWLLLAACTPGSVGGLDPPTEATTTEATTTEADESSDATGDATAPVDPCAASDLPPPFCHRIVELGLQDYEEPGWRRYASLYWPWRWLSLYDEEDGPRTRIVSRFGELSVLGEFELPFEHRTHVSTGHFDPDGVPDWLFGDEQEIVVVDGASFDVVGTADMTHEVWYHQLARIDVDGDGIDEVVTAGVLWNDEAARISIWRVTADGLARQNWIDTGVGCYIDPFVEGDFDGDGRTDVVTMFPEGCEPYFEARDLQPQITTIFGGSGLGSGIELRQTPQPIYPGDVIAGDFDGDGDDELFIGHERDPLFVYDWTSSGFVEARQFAIGDPWANGGGLNPRVGDLDGDGRDELVVDLLRLQDDWLFRYTAIQFPLQPEREMMVLDGDRTYTFAGTIVGSYGFLYDFNDDGIADITTAIGTRAGFYLSVDR